jgi:ketosteroid isomerase-like protein
MDQSSQILEWLRNFEKCVRKKNFEDAKQLYTATPVLFGTRVQVSTDIEEYYQFQWLKIWNTSENFAISEVIHIGSGADYSFAAVLWTNTTQIHDKQIERSGRATFVFEIEDGVYRAAHSHFSESPK